MASSVATLPAVGPLLGSAFDKAFVIFVSRWRLLLVFGVLTLVAGFINITLAFFVLWAFTVYWFFASLANAVRLTDPSYTMNAEAVARLIGIGFIYGICVEIALLLFIVPGVYVATKWSLAQFICVKESVGVDSLSRSWALTEGAFWETLWFNILAALAVAAVGIGGYLLAGAALVALGSAHRTMVVSTWNGGGWPGMMVAAFFAIYFYAIAYTYQAKDLAMLYWYQALTQARTVAVAPSGVT